MDPDDWRARWAEGRTGWHERAPNPHLVAHGEVLAGARRILVPLCGKSLDLGWLAARPGAPSVVGVELVEDAARAYFEEQGIAAHRTHDGPFVRYEAGTVEIVASDFFEVGTAELGRFDGCYDRAALVAIQPERRAEYVGHLRSMLEPGARVLLVTFADQRSPGQPPFAVREDEVRALYAGCRVTLLDATSAPEPELVFGIELPS